MLRDQWLQTIDHLQNQIADWVRQEPGWVFEEDSSQEINEPPLGEYTVTTWRIGTPSGEVRLEPIARNYPSRGIVELYAWPTAYRVRLIADADSGDWQILTDSGIYLHQPWDHEHFLTLINDLVGAEDMIAVG